MKIIITSNFKRYFKTYIDFLDHYWLDYFSKKNYNFLLIPNSLSLAKKKLNEIKDNDLIILPGGSDLFESNKISKTRLNIEKNLINISLRKKIPLLGICRGMQLLNIFFGGKINKVKNHMKKKNKIFFEENFFPKKSLIVNCYHNYGIKNKFKSKKFKTIATDKEGNLEMFRHKNKNIHGIMWHPEREKNYKKLDYIFKKILKN